MVLEEASSPRTKASGLSGGGLFRDKVNEHVVRSVKTKLRNLHMSMKDLVIDKAVASLSTVHKVADHDIE